MGQSTQIMGGSLQARAVFRSGHIFNHPRCSTLAPVKQQWKEKERWKPPIFVSCLLLGPKGFTPLFR